MPSWQPEIIEMDIVEKRKIIKKVFGVE